MSQSELPHPSFSIAPTARGIDLLGWLMTALSTLICFVLMWRLAVYFHAMSFMAAAYALPIALASRGLLFSLVSFLSITLVGLLVLLPAGADAVYAFLTVGCCTLGATLYLIWKAGQHLGEARLGLGIVRARARGLDAALSQAGIATVVAGRNKALRSINRAAWQAFGTNPEITSGMSARHEFDGEVVVELMHSGSRESWRNLVEAAAASGIEEKPPGAAAPSRLCTFFGVAGTPINMRWVVTKGFQDEVVYVGQVVEKEYIANAPEVDSDVWFETLADSLCSPCCILERDGTFIAVNASFMKLSRRAEDETTIFDVPGVSGIAEPYFDKVVWGQTSSGITPAPEVHIDNAGEPICIRVKAPSLPSREAVMLVFAPVLRS